MKQPEGFGPASRVALYYAPATDDPLWRRGTAWLGRDPETGASLAQPDLPELAAITGDARGYGFHATLRPPMRLRAGVGWEDFCSSVAELAASLPPFALPPLAVVDLSGFLALHEADKSPELQALCDACVAWVDHLREPPTEAELARRRAGRLSAAEDANLARWGYQYVFATWFFHMTLTRRLTPDEQVIYRPAAEAWFADVLAGPREVREIAVFVQTEPGTPFDLAARVGLRG